MLDDYQDIMTVSEIADTLYIGKNRVYELLESGVIKGFRIGRVWKIPKEALQEYILTQSRMGWTDSGSYIGRQKWNAPKNRG